jgi:hypothetical protein
VNSWVIVSDLRDPEVKQRERHSYESGFVSRVEKHHCLRNKVAEFSKSRGKKNQKAIFRCQVSKDENCEGQKIKQGWLQHL